MFKKMLTVVFIMGIVATASASVTQLSNTYTSRNGTDSFTTTNVSTTTIKPGIHKIMGYTVMPTKTGTLAPWAALYDSTGSIPVTSTLLNEAEAPAGESETVVFPYPKSLSNGLTIVQGPQSVVMIDYAR